MKINVLHLAGRRGRKHATQKQIQGLIDDDDYSENDDDDTYSLRGGRNRRRERPMGTRRSGRVSKPTIQYYPSQEESQLRREKLANERAMRAERRNRIMYYDDDDDDDDDDESPERRAYSLRTRREKPNYIIPPPIDNIRDVPDDIGRLPSFTAMQHPGIDVIPWNSKNNFGLGDQDSDNVCLKLISSIEIYLMIKNNIRMMTFHLKRDQHNLQFQV